MSWNPFRASRPDVGWISVGLASSFPNLDDDMLSLAEPRPCSDAETRPGCKVFKVPQDDTSRNSEVVLVDEDPEMMDLKEQVVVFRYKGKFYAVDHQCPHASFPLSRGTPFDIEDFGMVLSAGVTCPKHGWSFDLITGMADHARYKLKTWEVQLRDVKDALPAGDAADPKVPQEVWVRRKPKMG